MGSFIAQFFRELLGVFLEASPYVLLGFTVAACIQFLLPVRTVQRFLGRGRVRSIFGASLLGIPLPLCSCSVLPTALALRKRGANRGATIAFLVSTPETGIDSIALTYGLMDPLMAIYRPFTALVSAVTAGFATDAFGGREKAEVLPADPTDAPADAPACDHCEPAAAGDHAHDALAEEEARDAAGDTGPLLQRMRRGFRSAFVELFDETSHWMFAGLVISALISVLLPAEIVTRYLSSGAVPLFLMLAIGIPLYICASASTPIAAALVLKGLSPGAALVFLVAGPATNVGSLAILTRFFGRRVMAIYITTICVLSLVLGAALDLLYPAFGISPGATIDRMRQLPPWISWTSAVVFAGLLLASFRRASVPREIRVVGRGIEWLLGFRLSPRRLGLAALGAVAIWGLTTCIVVVPPGHRGLVRHFGAPAGPPRGEGLHFKLPPPFGAVDLVDADAVRRIEIGFRSPASSTAPPGEPGQPITARRLEEESLFLTGDENLLATQSFVQYRVLDAQRYVYGFADPDDQIRLQAIAEILEVLAGHPIDGIYTEERAEVQGRVLEGLRHRVEALDLGVEIVDFGIRDVHAPPEIHAAFRDVASAQEDKQTAINVAYRYLDETRNLARGEAAREVEVAHGYALGQVLRAEGESESLTLRSRAYRERPTGTTKRLYLETVEEVLANAKKIVRPGPRGVGHVDLWISNGGGPPVPVDDVLRGSDAKRSDLGRSGQ